MFGVQHCTKRLKPSNAFGSLRHFSASARRDQQRLVILGSGWGGYEVLRGIDKSRWSMSVGAAPDS